MLAAVTSAVVGMRWQQQAAFSNRLQRSQWPLPRRRLQVLRACQLPILVKNRRTLIMQNKNSSRRRR